MAGVEGGLVLGNTVSVSSMPIMRAQPLKKSKDQKKAKYFIALEGWLENVGKK